MIRTTIASLFAFALAAPVFAQTPGSNDATFNPGDQGFGIGDPIPTPNGWSTFVAKGTAMAVEGGGRILLASYAQYSPSSTQGYLERRNADGSLDASFQPLVSFFGEITAIAVQTDGKILVGGSFLSYLPATSSYGPSSLLRLNTDGGLDASFSIGTGFASSSSPTVGAIVIQPNGRILVGGTFSSYNSTALGNLVRLNTDGTRDGTWSVATTGGRVNGTVLAIALRADGGVYVGGSFTTAGNQPRNRIARFTSGGTLVTAFNPGTGCNAAVRALVVPGAGSVLVAGDHTDLNGTPQGRITKLTETGSIDATFTTGAGFNNSVNVLNLRSDGTLMASGNFTAYDGTTRNRLALLNADGTLSTSFDPGSGPNSSVLGSATLASGKILAVGSFNACAGVQARGSVRLNADGTMDQTYALNGFNANVSALAVLPDGRILVGGDYNAVNGSGTSRISRLMPNGDRDPSFVGGVTGMSFTDALLFRSNELVPQPDGRVIAAGTLMVIDQNNNYRGGLVRLELNGAADLSFNAGLPAYQEARAVSLQNDGKIIAANNHYNARNNPASYSSTLKRYNSDGTSDNGFLGGTTANRLIRRTAVLPDGRVFVVGDFANYAGSGRSHVLRLNSDGTVDNSFNYSTGFAGGTPGDVLTYADGRCILSGTFTSYDGYPTNGLVRLQADGSLDPTFAPTIPGGGPLIRDLTGKIIVEARYRLNEDGSTDGSFNTGSGFSNTSGPTKPLATAVHQGAVLAVGDFTSLNGTGRNRIARLVSIVYSDITLPVRTLLDGPFVPATNLMNDDLRAAGLLPTTEPFTALGFTHVAELPVPAVDPSVFNPTTPVFSSIVDWVMVELRSATNSDSVVQTRTGLIQRDGDIVGPDGGSPLVFHQPLGNYHVAVRHRNHLGCMTAAPVALSSNNAMLNFSVPTTATHGLGGQKASGTRMVLWAGDVTHNGEIKYTGSANDRDPILVKVGSTTPNNTTSGYFSEDVNMDGTVKYTGSANDRDPILVNVGSTTPNNVRMEQLP